MDKPVYYLYSQDPGVMPDPIPEGLNPEELEAAMKEFTALLDEVVQHFKDRGQAVVSKLPNATRFQIAPLPRWFDTFHLNDPNECPNDAARAELAFRASVKAIVIPPLALNLTPPASGRRTIKRNNMSVAIAPESWIEELGKLVGTPCIQEIGRTIIARSHLGPGEALPFSWQSGRENQKSTSPKLSDQPAAGAESPKR